MYIEGIRIEIKSKIYSKFYKIETLSININMISLDFQGNLMAKLLAHYQITF